MNNPKVSLVIPVYNRAFMLEAVIRSLLSQTYKQVEIVMVDDGSEDGSFEIMKRFPQLVAIRQENRGPAGARNTGLQHASGQIVLFMDSDAIAPPHLAAIHVKQHQKHPAAIVQGQVIPIMDLADAFKVPFSFRYYRRPFFATGNVSVPKIYVDALGGFDEENFRKGWEDLDLGLRLRKIGLKVKRLAGSGAVWHYEGSIRDEESIRSYFTDRFLEGRSAVDFYRKHPSLSVKLMTMAGGFFFFLDRCLFNESHLESQQFYDRILSLWNRGKKGAAFARLDFAGYHYYLKGLQDRIKEDGYLRFS